MPWYKRIELWAKLALALLASALLWRPGRRLPAGSPLPPPRKILLVRPDNRVGEALLTTPLLRTLKALPEPRPVVHVLVHTKVARVLAGHPDADSVIAFDRRRLWLGALAPGIRALRRERYDMVVDCANWDTPSVTSALVSRLVGPGAVVIGPRVWPVSLLHSLSVPARPDTRREATQRAHLLSPLAGGRIAETLSFREPNIGDSFRAWLEQEARRPCAVVNPGGRLGWRRIPPEAFAAAARALLASGRVPIVTWGPGEEALAQSVIQGAPGARMAPPTNLDELAALMRAAGLTVTNNTGPMHLSVAVGAPTLGLFLRIDMERWGHPYAPHRMVDLTPVVDSQRGSDALNPHPRPLPEGEGMTLEERVFEEVRAFATSLTAERGLAPPRS
jgi:heptosyltransferase-3